MSNRKYTDKQKIAYYKKKALQGRGAYTAPRRVSRARSAYGSGISGRGAYKKKSDGSSNSTHPVATAGGGAIGGIIGGLVGGPGGIAAGSAIGSLAGNALGNLLGFGAYTTRRNTIVDMISEGNDPARMHTSKSELVVTHREYITDIISNSNANTFTLQAFPINPGLSQSYPWLATIAQQFEEYEILGMVYEFKSLSADAIANTTNTALGYVIMATDYNSINANFVNKQQMENTEYTTSIKPSLSTYHPIECDTSANPLSKLYVRAGAVPTNSDQRMYDMGIFQIATSVPGTSVVLGELWCTYQVRLRKPISTSALGQDVLTDHAVSILTTNAAPLTGMILQTNSSIGGTFTGTKYSWPAVYQEGTYLMCFSCHGSAASITAPLLTYANCQVLNVWLGDVIGANSVPTNGVSSAYFSMFAVIQITGLNATVTFGGSGVLPSSISNADFVMTQWDSNVTT